jgi:hypothetical protein
MISRVRALSAMRADGSRLFGAVMGKRLADPVQFAKMSTSLSNVIHGGSMNMAVSRRISTGISIPLRLLSKSKQAGHGDRHNQIS